MQQGLHRPGHLPQRRAARGVSLVEALVALAAMAIGLLGLVGVQSSLRSNSDIAKQRTEAVRLAQEAIEEWRAFVAMTSAPDGVVWTDITPGTLTEAPIPGSNTEFTRSRTVTELAAPMSGKSLHVDVGWADRQGEAHNVRLSTFVAGIAPGLAMTLGVPGDGDGGGTLPQGRHRAIPPQAKDIGGGRSGFMPPDGGNVAWMFDNLSGLITFCTTTAASTADLADANLTCTNDRAQLLSGFVRYAYALGAQPTDAEALDPPPDLPLPLQVLVQQTSPLTQSVACFVEPVYVPGIVSYTAYYCAVPVLVINPTPPPAWSGTVVFGPAAYFATTLSEFDSNLHKVCRYFANATYTGTNRPLANQNYLVIGAGNGITPFVCPGTANTPPTTYPHQPSS